MPGVVNTLVRQVNLRECTRAATDRIAAIRRLSLGRSEHQILFLSQVAHLEAFLPLPGSMPTIYSNGTRQTGDGSPVPVDVRVLEPKLVLDALRCDLHYPMVGIEIAFLLPESERVALAQPNREGQG